MDESHHPPDGWGSFLEWEDDNDVLALDKWQHADPAYLETDRNTLGKEVAEKGNEIKIVSAGSSVLRSREMVGADFRVQVEMLLAHDFVSGLGFIFPPCEPYQSKNEMVLGFFSFKRLPSLTPLRAVRFIINRLHNRRMRSYNIK